MTMKAENTYLFIAQYNDGFEYLQDAEDTSVQEEGKNAFYDIYYKPHKPLEMLYRFGLVPADGDPDKPQYWVDFRNGAFEINGHQFLPYGRTIKNPETDRDEPLRLSNPRLIYFRITDANISLNQSTGEMTPSSLSVAGYVLGYQCNDQFGNNLEFIMRI